MTRQRNITDEEICLIKAMLKLKIPNDKVHFYFNRADRLVSSGRIRSKPARCTPPAAERMNKHRSGTPAYVSANLLIQFMNWADSGVPTGADADPTPNEFPQATSKHCGYLSWGPASVLIHRRRGRDSRPRV